VPRRHPPVWLLDLDNTLHDAGSRVFPRIDIAMTRWVAQRLALPEASASELRLHYWRRYGATLLGLLRHHDIDPHAFLRETHRFPDLHRIVARDHALRDALRRLPGRKIVVTTGPREYARAVLRLLGVAPLLDGLVTIEDMRFAGRWHPKPSRRMLSMIAARLRVPPSSCVLVEDSVANLADARAVGMRTVLVARHTHGVAHPARRPRAGIARRVGVQLQSAVLLPRVAARLR
jgi:putative hydrolase of the HAD superfamily